MKVQVTPRRADVQPGLPIQIAVTISNPSTVIGGYALRVLGADPGWVQLDTEQISLFPDESRTVFVTITVPPGIPAGGRRVAVQVRELTPPESSVITEIDLTVPSLPAVQMRVDPLAVTAGRRASYSVLLENTGNTTMRGRLAGDDPEGKVRFRFDPERVSLTPGEHLVIDMRASARRPFAGSPVVRQLQLHLDDRPEDDFFAESGADEDRPDPIREDKPPLGTGTFIQKPLLSRGPISLFGLLAAVTVFAIVITLAMSRLVGQSAADRDLALQVAQARDATTSAGSSSVAGTVRLLTSGSPVAGVAVNIFAASDTTAPLATTATDNKGAYSIGDLAAGDYKLSFRGAGFVQLWYPDAATDANATTVTLKASQSQAGLDVRLGGVPASIAGSVVGDDVSAATLYLETAASGTGGGTSAQALPPRAATPGSANPLPNNGEAIVRTVPIGSDGTFTLSDVPSPSVYDLVVSKTGYATSTQRIDIGAGEDRKGVEIRLQQGDGLISGQVNSATGPLGGVTITATSGQSTANTVSLTDAKVGSFTLRSLPTPASFTLVASADGYASQTLTLTLAAGQKLTGVSITLGQSAGSIKGIVTAMPGGQPASGVSVTVTDGQLTVQTVTESSGQPGGWTVGGLVVPDTYTVTFSRSDLAPQTVSVSLDASGQITPGSLGATITSAGITVSMQSATATVYGQVTQPSRSCGGVAGLGEATVTLNSGSSSYTVTTASTPASACGQYRIEKVPPGTYTLSASTSSGTSPFSRVITLSAGQVSAQPLIQLAAPDRILGTVCAVNPNPGCGTDSQPRAGWTVTLYLASQYPTVVTATTITDSTGAFSFADVPAGIYIIEVRPTPGSQPSASTTANVLASATVHVAIQGDPSG